MKKTLDHIALRLTPEKHAEALELYTKLFDYKVIDKFSPTFSKDPSDTQGCTCNVLCPPINEKTGKPDGPQLFISSSTDPTSIVAKWVAQRQEPMSSVHHCAYVVKDIDEAMKELKGKGIEFLGEDVIVCENGLKQTFTKPSETLGFIVELIQKPMLENGELEDVNFCKASVGSLMKKTEKL